MESIFYLCIGSWNFSQSEWELSKQQLQTHRMFEMMAGVPRADCPDLCPSNFGYKALRKMIASLPTGLALPNVAKNAISLLCIKGMFLAPVQLGVH